jgi:threonine dehydratase
MTSPVTIEHIRAAALRVAPYIHRTPLVSATLLGRGFGVRLFCKCENLQKTGSFKVRGAMHKIARLSAEERRRGVVTISAGNHAQAVGWAAAQLDTPSVVVMPEGASPIKASASRGYGAEVVIHGTVHEAFEKAHQLARERDLTFVHPFDDDDTIAGQGTVGLELMEQIDEPDLVIVPVGGGGLISGTVTAIKAIRPSVTVIGVEPEGACAMRRSLDAGQVVHLDAVNTVADGLAPPMAGTRNLEIVRRLVDDVVVVNDDDIIDAMGLLLTRTKLLTEPAGAAGLAGLLSGRITPKPDSRVVLVLSGGNVSLARISEFSARWNAL